MSRAGGLGARALLAVLVLPGVVAGLIPVLVARPWARPEPFATIGLVPLLPGIALLLWCVRDVSTTGRGTLAPWDPPRRLVTTGPYRWSRNPMYVAVGLVLLGWAVGDGSWALWLYGVVVVGTFHARVVWGEEPWLTRTHGEAWTRYHTLVPRWIFPTRRLALLSWLGVAAVVLLTGLGYEAYAGARAAAEFPPPGTLIDVGGRRLHLLCLGRGEPTVIFEGSGFGVTSLSAAAVRERVARRTRVCSYDRQGMAWSDPGPGAVSAADLARDVAVLQDRAALDWPFVLVGSSVGGLTVEMFARQYPERVAGLVFVDAVTSDVLDALEPQIRWERAAVRVGRFAARFGLIRLLDPFGIPVDSDEGRRSAALTYGTAAIGTVAAIVAGLDESRRAFDDAPPLPADIPLVVLSADSPDPFASPEVSRMLGRLSRILASVRVDAHQQLAARSTRGVWRVVPESDHLIAVSHPDAVADAVLETLGQIP